MSTAITTSSSAELFRDKWFGRWVITKAPDPLPFWQATSTSYKGGTATVIETSREALMRAIADYADKHERLLATRDNANTISSYSMAGFAAGLLAAGVGAALKNQKAMYAGGTLVAIGLGGLVTSTFVERAAIQNKA